MSSRWTTDRFPQFAEEIRRLIEQHRELEDEPLHLAICYDPGRDPQDIFLFEVVGEFANGEINPENDLFEAEYLSTPEFPLASDAKLHLVLTSPEELSVAIERNWPLAAEIRRAVQHGDFQELYRDEEGARMLGLIRD